MRSAAVIALACAGCGAPAPMVTAPRFGGQVVTSERADLACRGPKDAPHCELTGRYGLLPSDEPRPAVAASEYDSSVELRAGGQALPGEKIARSPLPDDEANTRPSASWRRYSLPAGAREVELAAVLHPSPRPVWLVLPAPLARHWFMAKWIGLKSCRYETDGCVYDIDYVPTRPEERLPGAARSFATHLPEGWQADGGTIRTGADVVAPGGPFFGAGPVVWPKPEARWFSGYELFAPYWVAHALALEGHASELWLAPSIEMTTPMLFVLPSFGAGVGLPLRLSPSLRPGVRLQASLAWPLFSMRAELDLAPRDGAPGQLALLGRFSL